MGMRYIKSGKITHTLECTGQELLDCMNGNGQVELPDDPSEAKIEICVPGGGDYSNMRLDFRETDLIVTWEDDDEDVQEFH